MKTRTILAVKAEIKRISDTIQQLEAHGHFSTDDKHVTSPKHTGAVKRASMDLTRALANLRRPDA